MADEVHELLDLSVTDWEVEVLVKLELDVHLVDHILLVLVKKAEAVSCFFVAAALLRPLDVVLSVSNHLFDEGKIDTVPWVVLVKELSIEAFELIVGLSRRHRVVTEVLHNVPELSQRNQPVVVRVIKLKCLSEIVDKVRGH